MTLEDLIQNRGALHAKFINGDMEKEEEFVSNNLELIRNAYRLYQDNGDKSNLRFILETNDRINEKLSGTALTMTFFKKSHPGMIMLNTAVEQCQALLSSAPKNS